MRIRIFRTIIFSACLICLLGSQSILAKKMYRWVDENGNTYFSDQVPPGQAKHSRASLSKTGRVLEITEEAKTTEQLEQDKRLDELRKEQGKLIANQKTYDKALLSTFRSKEDMLLAMQVKTESLNKQKNIIEGNLKRFTEQLKKQQKEAGEFERNAQPVPKKLLDEIVLTQHQINYTQSALQSHVEKHNQIKKIDEADIARFLFLTQSTKDKPPRAKIPSIKEANELGLFYCENDHQCRKAWEIGRIFVNFHSTTEADVYNEELIMNRPPPTDADISLSLSKLAINEDDYQLFLDIRCRDSLAGKQLCASQKVKDIRSSFRAYVNDALSRDALSSKVPTP
ncbi:DUF4124 domain-containing protein [Methylobacter sp. S3L5C]|uniref:DUF4124 domain-containing protein n=1 Tax=Methylobacter sp. S3L5C TaxID=2839024 RepID=UPI001FAE62CF|nr:DUF4124 domain-containing protein [Methylobacter sp. S3L5C]UOA09616.1 DUF4124 domain-containing protein [Methylobacter sp. S3L5C]